jgi:hypothetical protein
MNTVTELPLTDYVKIKGLDNDQIRLRLRCAIILLRQVQCGTKIIFTHPGGFVDMGYVPYPADFSEETSSPLRDVYTLQLVPRPPRVPPPPIVLEIDEIALVLDRSRDINPVNLQFPEGLSLANLLDMAMMHLQKLIHEGDRPKQRMPPPFTGDSTRSIEALDFLVMLAASSLGGEKYICTIIQLNMNYMRECCQIDRTFGPRLLRAHGFEDEETAFKHLYDVMWRFRAFYMQHSSLKVHNSQPLRVAIQMLEHKMLSHPKIVAAEHESRTLGLWLSNEYKAG